MKSHKLDDDVLITPALQRRLQDEADFEGGGANTPWWAGCVRSNGRFKAFSFGYDADYAEKLMAEQVCKALNAELAHDGAWIVQWTDFGVRFCVLWMDSDGDVQFTADALECVAGMVGTPLHRWISQFEDAWHHWRKAMRSVLAPKPEQLFRHSLGERPISLRSPRLADDLAGIGRHKRVGPVIL